MKCDRLCLFINYRVVSKTHRLKIQAIEDNEGWGLGYCSTSSLAITWAAVHLLHIQSRAKSKKITILDVNIGECKTCGEALNFQIDATNISAYYIVKFGVQTFFVYVWCHHRPTTHPVL